MTGLTEATLHWFNELIPRGVLITDANLVIRGWNRWLESHSGHRTADVLGRPLFELYPDLVQRGLDEHFRAALAGQPRLLAQRFHHYLLPLAADRAWKGETMAQSAYIAPLSDGQQIFGTITLIEDVTERVAYEERLEELVERRTAELRQAQEQLLRREKLAVLGKLAGSIAHELRNPLGVMANIAYLLGTMLPQDNRELREYLQILSQEIDNSTRIITDLLDFSRTSSPKRGPAAAAELVTSALRRYSVPERITVNTELPDDLPQVLVDPLQIEQVLINLVSNACDAMPEGGQLTISGRVDGDFVALAVRDSGHGIAQKHLDNLFEPLFTTKPRGIGLGLAISKTLVEGNQGSIEVESREGQGATFTVRLPVYQEGAEEG